MGHDVWPGVSRVDSPRVFAAARAWMVAVRPDLVDVVGRLAAGSVLTSVDAHYPGGCRRFAADVEVGRIITADAVGMPVVVG